jgi:5,10-methylenetetrahydromethanopterin reductase
MTMSFGVMFPCVLPPEELIPWARGCEGAGFDEFYIVEDCFFAAGISSVTAALAATSRVKVGLGIVPSVARNAAFTAMEFATIARLLPGRFLPGIGHGVGAWMKQIGAFPESQLAALEEVTVAVRRLLSGETVTMQGRHVYLDGVTLDFPPAQHLPISLGVRNAKSLAVAGRVADGTILAEASSTAYVEWAKTQIAATAAHPITMFAWWAPTHDALRSTIAETLADSLNDVRLTRPGLLADVLAWREAGSAVNDVPDPWIDELAFVGSIDAAKEKAQGFDVSSVIFTPIGGPPFSPR